MAKSNGFWGKSCAGFAGCESAHGARANVHGQRCERTWAVQPARQSVGNGAAMWALANVHGQRSLLASVRATVQPIPGSGTACSWDWLRG